MTYAYAAKTIHHVPAQIAGEECERLAEENRLTPKNLLDENRPEEAPLHKEFEWDDSVAAEKYRVNQAASIIRSVVIQPVEKKPPIRAFVRVTTETTKYTPMEVVLQRPDLTSALLADAWRELRQFQQKYSTLSELAPIFNAIQEAREA